MTQALNESRTPDQIFDPGQVPYHHMRTLFEGRIARNGTAVRQFTIRLADRPIRIRVLGDELASSIGRVFSHVRIGDRERFDLAIDIWDERATGLMLDSLGDKHPDDPPVLLKASDDSRYVCEERHHGTLWLDRKTSYMIGCTRSFSRQNLDERARPFHKMLSIWLQDRGVQFVHAGLIDIAGKGILFVGNGGAGKSTSSITCMMSGIRYLGDDFIGLSGLNGDTFTGFGFYASCLLNNQHLDRFPDLKPLAHPPNHEYEEKSVLYLSDIRGEELASSVEIRALLLPKVVDSETTRTRPASAAEALLAVAPTSVMYLPSPNADAFHRLTRLVESVPSYWLELGRDVNQIPECIERLGRDL